ncbi:MAG: FAD-dependent oxidoreductase [Nitrososphaeria archaeon]|jgi:thioredoxin reductase (NADPH)
MLEEKMIREFDIIIIGAGPAGLVAALYAARSVRSCIIIDKLGLGGQVVVTDIIENYPGFKKISGQDLAQKLVDHVMAYDVPIEIKEVQRIVNKGKRKIIVTDGIEYSGKTVIIATGTKPKKLMITGGQEFIGKGISYCALCDAQFFKGGTVAVVGGGDRAVKEAIYLSRLVKKVYVIHRRDSLRAEKTLQKKAFQMKNIKFLWSTDVISVNGSKKVESLTLNRKNTEEQQLTLNVNGVFVYIGVTPCTEVFEVEKDKQGFIKVDGEMMTSIKGIFAAGDCAVHNRDRPWGQISISIGEGAKAAI